MESGKTRLTPFALAVATVLVASVPISGQWLNHPTAGIPRLADGTPNLSAPTPRAADGKPDLSGIWERVTGGRVLVGVEVPFQPWAEATQRESWQRQSCVQVSASRFYRQIFTDGRELPKDPNPSWVGYSVGHWEGDTLVVHTIGYNDRGWLDGPGPYPRTEALHVVERYRRPDFGHLELQMTIDDPKAYTKPWSITVAKQLLPDTEILEYVCAENERSVEHLVGK
jgi:hypothetical protein